nr:IS21-like element helper ATPase IstB [Mycolicibacterium fortuitum]
MATTKTSTPGRDVSAELAYLTRALKAPTLRDSIARLAERARAENWTHEEYLAACLQREVSARESHGGEGRIRAARFPARKSLEEFDFDHARGLKRDIIAHLGTLDFVTARDNVVFLGPPGTGKTHLAIGLAMRACQAAHRVLFATAAEWVARLAEAHQAGRIHAELTRLGRYPLIVIDEVGYIPFEPEAANLFFQLVSARYERASLIVTSNKAFGKAHLFARTCAEVALKRDMFAGIRVARGGRAVGPRRGDRRDRSSLLRVSSRTLPRRVSGRSY